MARVDYNWHAQAPFDADVDVDVGGLKEASVTDDEIAAAFAGTNFGHARHRELLNASVFKKMLGYHCGHTITTIMREMGLIGKTGKPTVRGVNLVRKAYSGLMKVSR